MIRIPLRVLYRDGTTAEIDATQYALAAYGVWCARERLPQPVMGRERDVQLTDMHALRYWAWAELQRDMQKPRVTFEVWSATVDEVEAGTAAPLDPTPPATPAGSSP